MDIFLLYSGYALALFRAMVGVLLLVHGIPKLKNWKQSTDWFQSVGFKPGWFWGTVAGVLETFGGLFIIDGWFLRILAVLFIGEFAVIIIWKIFRRVPFKGDNGWELDYLILGAMLILLTFGKSGF